MPFKNIILALKNVHAFEKYVRDIVSENITNVM